MTSKAACRILTLVSIGGLIYIGLTSAAQFPWADSNPAVTETTLSVFDLRRPDFPAERVQEFLNQTVPGRDYPDFNTIPVTNFTCKQVEQPGFYADPETGCQVYRRCAPTGEMFSFLCPFQTVFDQLILTCDFFIKSIATALWDYTTTSTCTCIKAGKPFKKTRSHNRQSPTRIRHFLQLFPLHYKFTTAKLDYHFFEKNNKQKNPTKTRKKYENWKHVSKKNPQILSFNCLRQILHTVRLNSRETKSA